MRLYQCERMRITNGMRRNIARKAFYRENIHFDYIFSPFFNHLHHNRSNTLCHSIHMFRAIEKRGKFRTNIFELYNSRKWILANFREGLSTAVFHGDFNFFFSVNRSAGKKQMNQANTFHWKNIYDRECRCAAHASNRILQVQHRRATWISARSDNFCFFCSPFVCLFVVVHQTERIFLR